jgi:GNAT superfamily N-acetyltransferase
VRSATWDQLSGSVEPQRIAVELAGFSGYLSRRTVGILRRREPLLADYAGLFAVEGGRLLGQLFVRRIPFRTATGVEPVAGIASVTTRLDDQRRGVARALLEEAHRRESAAGVRFAMLWTNPSWYAHTLYERLGYRDVWSAPSAVRLLPRARRAPREGSLSPALPRELPSLERLFDATTGASVGFSVRPRGFLREGHEAGYLDLEGLLVLRRRGELLGYAVVSKCHDLLRSGEIVVRPDATSWLLGALEHRAAPGVLALGNSPVLAMEPELRRRGYRVDRRLEWRALMAAPLDGVLGPAEVRAALAVDRPSFRCMSLDRF